MTKVVTTKSLLRLLLRYAANSHVYFEDAVIRMSTHTINQEDEFAQPMQTTETAQQGQYEAYLLRLWRNDGQTTWRASLQPVRTDERHMFADVDSLLAFLNDHYSLGIKKSD